MDWSKLGTNVALAAVAAFAASMAATDFALTKSVLIAAVYAAGRAAVGALGQYVQSRNP